MTGREILQLTIDSLFVNGDLDILEKELTMALEQLIADDVNSIEINDFNEVDINDGEIVFYFSINDLNRDSDFNRRREPFAYVSINPEDYEMHADKDFN